MDNIEIPALPENLAELSDEDIAELAAQIAATFGEVREADPSPERTAAMRTLVESARTITTAQGERAEASRLMAEEAATLEAEMAALSDTGTPDEPEGEPEPEATPEPVEVTTTVPVAPAQTASARVPAVARRVPANRQPRAVPSGPRVSITAGADVPGFGIGQRLAGMDEIVTAMVARSEQLGSASRGVDEKVVVASIHLDIPSERMLSPMHSERANSRMVRDAIDRTNMRDVNALTAAGGLCAPVGTFYDQLNVGNTGEPVGDALPGFGAERGGIRFVPGPALSSITGSVATLTAAIDLAGGAPAVKTCLNVACDAIVEVDTVAIYSCLEFNNWGALTFPERVEAQTQLALVQAARVSEQVRLDGIAAGSLAVNRTSPLGSVREFTAALASAAAGIRSRNRLAPDYVLDLYAPSWTPALFDADWAAGQFLNPSDAPSAGEIAADLAGLGIRVTWYFDSKTAGSQVFAAQSAGVLNAFPTNCLMYLHVPGTFVGLQGATLNIGLIRDSALTMGSGTSPGNRYRVFTETWANVAKVSNLEALEISIPSCPTGTTGAPSATALTCATVQA